SPKGRGDAEPAETALFDLESDPGETRDVRAARPDLLAEMKEAMQRAFDHARRLRHGLRVDEADASTLRSMDQLGYVDGTRTNEEGALFDDDE
ncbi:MAG: hypothetical protein ACF8XB_22880, partial [Planctomycetota bacterium JB042]